MTLDIHSLRQDDWRTAFDSGHFKRGCGYAEQQRSSLLDITGQVLRAHCQGSSNQHYRQHITFHPTSQGWSINGRCDCPVGFNCKHVVAALLTLQSQQQTGTAPPSKPPQTPLVEQRLEAIQPVAVLTLGSHIKVHFDARKARMHEQAQHRAALAFDYQGHLAYGKQSNDLLIHSEPGHRLRIIRHPKAEAALRQRLLDGGLQPALRQSEALAKHPGEHFQCATESAWLNFVEQPLAALRAEGWNVELRPDFYYNLSTIEQWYAELEQAPQHSWFDLELGIEVDGQRISLLPILLHAISHKPWLLNGQTMAQRHDHEVLLVSLPGRDQRVALPLARLKPLLATLGELFLQQGPEPGTRLRLNRADLPQLQRLGALPELHWQGAEHLHELAKRLHALPDKQVSAPNGLRAELRPYQLQGLAWMQTLAELEVGGLLADDMGLGKTLQTLAHILSEKQAGRLKQPALIVMPTSLIHNWQDESARFAPQLRVLALHGSQRRHLFEQLAEHDLILTSYALLPRDLKHLSAQPYQLLILDEAQHIKNPRSKAALACAQLQTTQRLCLTGTPLENHLGELWSLFNFLMPGWLGDQKHFNQHYRKPIEKQADGPRLAHLHGRIRPFILRRTKEQVARELPKKTEITHWVELSQLQRDRYETLRLAMDQKVRNEIAQQGLARSHMVILEALLRLRQACCDLRLLGEPGESQGQLSYADSGKLSALLTMLEELLAENRRVLLFSQFTSMLALIEAELRARQIGYVKLTGSTQDRRTPVQQFQSGQFPVFLISLKAGGAGLNLTAADTVIHFDPWWNPASEAQASDRAYRIGQDKPVFVYKLISRGSVEEKIQHLQQAKASLAQSVLDEGSHSQWQLDEHDLQSLFAPLPD